MSFQAVECPLGRLVIRVDVRLPAKETVACA